MVKRRKHKNLGGREREIMDLIYLMGEASVGDVLEKLSNPPSYSSVRTMIRILESKGLLRHRSEGNKYIYRPTRQRKTASRSALRHVMKTFFGGSAAATVAAILGDNTDDLTEDDFARIEAVIERARKEGK